MIPAGMRLGEVVQHAIVALVAMGAVAVVLRRVLGVFEPRPATPTAAGGTPAGGPGCSHCAAKTAPTPRTAPR